MKGFAFTTPFLLIMLMSHNVWADSVMIENNISSSSRSGNNTAEDGTTVEGKATSEVHSTTVVNGETVEDVHKFSDDGTSIEVKTNYKNGNVETTTNVSAGTNANASSNADITEEVSQNSRSNSVIENGRPIATTEMEIQKETMEVQVPIIKNETFAERFKNLINRIFAYVFSIF